MLTLVFSCKLHGAAYGKGIYLSPISSISFGYSGKRLPALPSPACAPIPTPCMGPGMLGIEPAGAATRERAVSRILPTRTSLIPARSGLSDVLGN